MPSPHVLLLIYCGLIVTFSLAGGWLPSIIRLSHLHTQVLMSLVGGMMIGVATMHLLPHAAEHVPDLRWQSGALLAGVLSMLFLLRFGHVHQHGATHHVTVADIPACGHDHDHDHDHDSADTLHGGTVEAGSPTGHSNSHQMSWVGLFVGLAVHTLFDGVALGASVAADASHTIGAGPALLGVGTFLAIALHKPLDAMSITSVMKAGGWSTGNQWLINATFSLACPVGALAFWTGSSALGSGSTLTGCALAFSAGAFLCIALTDLIPEALTHCHDRFKLSAALLLGTSLAIGIELLPGHSHESRLPQQTASQQIDFAS